MLSRLIAEKIKNAGRVALIAHVSPDGDTLGSTLALSLALDKLAVENDVYCEDEVPHTYAMLPGKEKVMRPRGDEPSYPLAVSLDVSDFHRLGVCARIFTEASESIVVDHHMTNTGFGRHNLILDRSATAEIALSLIDLIGVSLDRDIAVCLFIALSTDTGNFNYPNTTGDALRTAARLVDTGIDVASITKAVYRMRTPGKTKLIGRAVSGMSFELDGRIAVMQLTLEDYLSCGANDAETEGLVNYGIECEGIDVSIMARETENGVKFSLRSWGDPDVGTLAGALGGGGHVTASGVTLPGPLKAAVATVLGAVKRALGA